MGDAAFEDEPVIDQAVDLGGCRKKKSPPCSHFMVMFPAARDHAEQLARLAGDLGIWLVPGSVCERELGGELFNTALAFSPEGWPAASYRKIFPWRPHEPYVPGDRFVVLDLPGDGRVGFTTCYDAWLPEVARHLAWRGAEVIRSWSSPAPPPRALSSCAR
ncbi:carbon-nitrogen hydrolase family protein [Streptomyces inhibens]|uniref:carbon-nitrogen hydrolase family protein n=1 Tax=Streptomyces inhibens TaxID=2293571 RepID=UPI001EE77D30|nr:carbon-nitrogen hydrolase family protein [Streptomyces inhibens]UKY48148.1 carbon-nitrogen hydrolase family protein [Streptomyces inhibens]